MATHNQMSILLESLLISALLLSLYFSSCDGTSRSIESVDQPSLSDSIAQPGTDPMATLCPKRSCQKSIVEQAGEQALDRIHPKLMHTSSMDSAASAGAEESISDSSMSDHDDSEWVRDSLPQRTMDSERLRDSGTFREGQTMTNSDRMRDSEWMRDSAHTTRDLARMRDPAAHRMSASDDTMRDMDRMISVNNMRDSQRMMDSDQMRDSHKIIHSHKMTHSENMRDSGRMMGPNRMGKVDKMSDRNTFMNPDTSRHSDRMYMAASDKSQEYSENSSPSKKSYMMDHEKTRASEEMQNSENLESFQRDSDQMTDTERMMDSESEQRDSERRTSSNDKSANHESEMTRGSDRTRASGGIKDIENTRNADNMDNDLGKVGSETMGDSDRNTDLEEWRDLENTREANHKMDTAASERHTHLKGENQRASEIMGSANQMGLNRRGDLERSRDSDHSSYPDDMPGSARMSINSHRVRIADTDVSRVGHMKRQPASTMRISVAGDNSRMGHMEKQPGSTMRISVADDNSRMGHMEKQPASTMRISVAGDNSRTGHMEKQPASTMRISVPDVNSRMRHMEKQPASTMRISVADDNSRIGHMERQNPSTIKPSSCNIGGKGCDAIHLTSSRNLRAERIDSSQSKDSEGTVTHSSTVAAAAATESCTRMNAADDCDVVLDGHLGSQKMGIRSKGDSDCKFNGAACRVTRNSSCCGNQKPIEHIPTSSEKSAGMSSCSDNHCHKSMATMEDEAMAGTPTSERMHRTREDREIVSSAKWKKLENMTPRVTHSDTSNLQSTAAYQTNRESNDSQSSRVVGSNCDITSGTTMSSRDEEKLVPNDETEMNHTGSKKSLENRDPSMNEENCVKDSQMDQITTSGEITPDSKMMCNSETKGTTSP